MTVTVKKDLSMVVEVHKFEWTQHVSQDHDDDVQKVPALPLNVSLFVVCVVVVVKKERKRKRENSFFFFYKLKKLVFIMERLDCTIVNREESMMTKGEGTNESSLSLTLPYLSLST